MHIIRQFRLFGLVSLTALLADMLAEHHDANTAAVAAKKKLLKAKEYYSGDRALSSAPDRH